MMIILVVVAFVAMRAPAALASNHQINGFHFQDCNSVRCVEVTAERAWLSQVGFGFSAKGPSRLVIRAADGKVMREFVGADAALHSSVQAIALDTDDGSLLYFLTDDSLRIMGSAQEHHEHGEAK